MLGACFAVVVTVATNAFPIEGGLTATGTIDSKTITFPESSLSEGVKATVGLLESCHDKSPFNKAELKKAKQGDHLRLSFGEPVAADVTNDHVKISELVFRLPMNTGVFWVRSENKWQRYTKFEFPKQKPFEDWLKMAQPAE